MDIILDPKGVERMEAALMERHLNSLEKICASFGDVVDIIRHGDDLGMNNGTLMRPDMYRKLFKSHHTI